jgi:hypothetical protein
MAFNGNFLCTSFKKELLQGTHTFANSSGDQFKIALFTNSAEPTQGSFGGSGTTMNGSVTTFSTNNEVAGGSTSVTSGGENLTVPSNSPNSSGTTAFVTFNNVTFASVTVTAVRGAIIYNSTESNKAVAILDFGSDKSASSGDFQIVFPTADASNAIIRIA